MHLNTPDIDIQDEEKLELFPFLFFLSVLSFFFILRDYYKFVSSYPFCRQAFLPFPPMDFNFLQHVDVGGISFCILHVALSLPLPSTSSLPYPVFSYPLRGMKWNFDIIFQLLHLLMVSLSYDILLFFSFTLLFCCIQVFYFAYFSSRFITTTCFIPE